MLGREEIRKLKEDYPEGTQIRLLRINGEEHSICILLCFFISTHITTCSCRYPADSDYL